MAPGRTRGSSFQKGAGYIDAAWLSLAAGRPARNLDSWMMGAGTVSRSFIANAVAGGINLIEGNRGLYDGEDARGTTHRPNWRNCSALRSFWCCPRTR